MEKCIVVTTLSDNIEIINKIQKELLEKHLVAGCQIISVNSTYWWNNKINTTKEYLLQMRIVKKLYKDIELIIKKNHNYKVPEISYYKIKGSKDIINWIKENTIYYKKA